MATGWSVAGSAEVSASGTSGSLNVHSPIAKRQVLGHVLAPAMPVVISIARTQTVAEGNLVHISSHEQRDSDDISVVSVASSNRQAVAQAKRKLELALLNEAKGRQEAHLRVQETALARIEVQIVEANQPIDSDQDGLSRDMSAAITYVDHQNEMDQRKAQLEQHYHDQLMHLRAEAQVIENGRLHEQEVLRREFLASSALARDEAQEEAARTFQRMQTQFQVEQQQIVAQSQESARRDEANAIVEFKREAEGRLQALVIHELGAAQSRTAESTLEVEAECERKHALMLINEENALREKATLYVQRVEQNAIHDAEASRALWASQETSAAQQAHDKVMQQWGEREASLKTAYESQTKRIRDLEQHVLHQQAQNQHAMIAQQQQTMEQREIAKQWEKRFEDERGKYAAKPVHPPGFIYATGTYGHEPMNPSKHENQHSSGPQMFNMHSPDGETELQEIERLEAMLEIKKAKRDRTYTYQTGDWTFAKSPAVSVTPSVKSGLARQAAVPVIQATASGSRKLAATPSIRSVPPVATPSRKEKKPVKTPILPTKEEAKEGPKITKGPKKKLTVDPTPPPSDYDEGEEGEEEEGDFENDEEVNPDGHNVSDAANQLLKLLQNGSSSSKDIPKKEAESIKLPNLPESAPGFRHWRNICRTEITGASGKGEKAFAWVMAVEKDGQTFDGELANPTAEFISLDAKLASALSKLTKGELGREVVQQQELAAKQCKMLKGRQILWMIHQHFAISQDAGSLYNIADLMSVRLLNDEIESFLNNWNHVLAGMESSPPKSLRNCSLNSSDIANCSRMRSLTMIVIPKGILITRTSSCTDKLGPTVSEPGNVPIAKPSRKL